MTFYLKLFLLTLTVSPLFAADQSIPLKDENIADNNLQDGQQNPIEPDWMEVEVIIFTHTSQPIINQALFTEQFENTKLFSFPSNITQLTQPQTDTPLLLFPNDRMPFITLPEGQLKLNDTANKLNQNSNYQVYYHAGWWQQLLPKNQAQSVLIEAGTRFGDNYELTGTIEISKDRFTQVDLDLRYNIYQPDELFEPAVAVRINAASTTESIPDSNSYFSQFLPNQTQYTAIQNISIKEFRQIEKERIIQYFDHPKLAAIVKLTQLQWPEETDVLDNVVNTSEPLLTPDIDDSTAQEASEENTIRRYAVPDEQGNIFIKTREEILSEPNGADIIRAIETNQPQ